MQAALEVLDVVRKTAQSGGQAFDDKNTVIRFEALARNAILKIRSESLDPRTDPGNNPIDHHLQTIIEGTSEFIAPGSGKSTLLRRLELDLTNQALRLGNDAAQAAPLTLFLPMNAYGQRGSGIPDPKDWIAMHWNRMTGDFFAFDALLRQPLMLLLDGLNEMPHADRADYNARLAAWKRFLEDLALNHPSVRVIFSCRTLDYGSQLTSKELPRIPQVEITALTDPQIEQFLSIYSPDHGESLWRQLKGTPQADLYRSPYYLKLLIDQTQDGEIPKGRAALFTGFVRATLQREIPDNERLREQDWLLTERDRMRIDQWQNDYELSKRGKLFNTLAAFAFQLQQKQRDGETGNVGHSETSRRFVSILTTRWICCRRRSRMRNSKSICSMWRWICRFST